MGKLLVKLHEFISSKIYFHFRESFKLIRIRNGNCFPNGDLKNNDKSLT